jgi:hypothetical protein
VNAGGTLVSADTYVTCYGGGFADGVSLSLDIARDGVVVASSFSAGWSAYTYTSCVPGNYVATVWATFWYPFGNIPGSESVRWQSPSYYISCVSYPVVANPGNQSMFLYDPASLQMTASGGAPPYTWSATGLPTGLSINPSTGLISGTGTAIANSTVTVSARDTAGRSGSTQFTWRVRREACPRC